MSAPDFALLFQRWESAHAILLAVSGGPDSMALLHLAAGWAKAPDRPTLYTATVDHGLRANARQEAQLVAKAAARLEIPHRILHWQGEKPKSGIQEKARRARYDLLIAHARETGADILMTAHHADDQAETILFRLLRGSGLTGLTGMKAESQRDGVTLARPLLGLRKTALVEICQTHEQPFAEDPSNIDHSYARTGLRTLLADLEKQGLGSPDWTQLGDRLARADQALAFTAENAVRRARLPATGGSEAIDLRLLINEPEEITLRVLVEAMDQVGATQPPQLEKLEFLHKSLRKAAKVGTIHAATLAGLKLRLDEKGVLTLRKEGPRQRGLRRENPA